MDIDANNFVNIDPDAATVLRANGFPVELGNVPYTVQDHRASWPRSTTSGARTTTSSCAATSPTPPTRTSSPSAASSPAAAARCSCGTDWSISASQTDILSARWVNEARVQFAHEDQMIQSLDPNCGGECLRQRTARAGPTLEVTGVASVGRQRFTPQPRLNERIQLMDTVSYFGGNHRLKAGLRLQLHQHQAHRAAAALRRALHLPVAAGQRAGGHRPAAARDAALRPWRRWRSGCPPPTCRATARSGASYKDSDLSLFLQDDWRITSRLTLKAGLRYQRQSPYDDIDYTVSNLGGTSLTYKYPADNNNFAPRVALAFDPKGNGRTSLHAAYGIFYDNQIIAIGADRRRHRRQRRRRADAGAALPGQHRSLARARPPHPGAHHALSQPGHRSRSRDSRRPTRTRPRSGSIAPRQRLLRGRQLRLRARQAPARHHRLQPGGARAGRGPAAQRRRGGVAGTSASILQYTSFGETWYRGLTRQPQQAVPRSKYQFMVSYTLSKAEDNSTDFQSAFIVQDNGRGRNPADPTGCRTGFDPDSEKGPATHDQRHRFVLSGLYQFPWDVQLSAIITAASGRPFNPLAGADLNGDGDGGAFPSDRARPEPHRPGQQRGRATAGPWTAQFIVDARLSKRFRFGQARGPRRVRGGLQPAQPHEFQRDQQHLRPRRLPRTSPQTDAQGRVTYGLYEQALPPRQIQLAAKVSF